MSAILLGRGLGQRSPRVLLCFRKRCIRSGKPQVYGAVDGMADLRGRGIRTRTKQCRNVLAGTEEEPDVMGERTVHGRRTTRAGDAG